MKRITQCRLNLCLYVRVILDSNNCTKYNRGTLNPYQGADSATHCQQCPEGKLHVILGVISASVRKICQC